MTRGATIQTTYWWKRFFVVALMIFLEACRSSAPLVNKSSSPQNSPNSGRYSIDQDKAPGRKVDVSRIAHVIPTALVRGSAGNPRSYEIFGKTYEVMRSEEGYAETGVASWYGEKFHGHKTSNGEIFDMYAFSAAHKSLPIPSFLQVTNLDNDQSLVVRVNDRGPFHGDRLIDLSYAAALKLGYADRGTARVALRSIVVDGLERGDSRAQPKLPIIRSSSSDKKYLQVGAFASRESAQERAADVARVTSRSPTISSIKTATGQVLHRVRIGPLSNNLEATEVSDRVVAADLGTPYVIIE
jgi:rare lipoprotein A